MQIAELEPSNERHVVRQQLAEKRREAYRLWFHIRRMQSSGLVVRQEKMTKLRRLRKECKHLSRQLRKIAPYTRIKTSEDVWVRGAFSKFRHSSRAQKWVKTNVFWKLR